MPQRKGFIKRKLIPKIAGSVIPREAESEDGKTVEFEVDAGSQAATNKERMEAMLKTQIEKASGIYSFTLASLDVQTPDGSLPFMSASALNGIRREAAQRLEQSSCGNRPFASPRVTEESAPVPETIDYKSNISNSIARETLRRLGAKDIEDAFELTHRKGAELMRTKYCVRHELGLCMKGPLYLVNNGKRYRLDFHCAECEMTVSKEY